MRVLGHSLLTALGLILMTVAPIVTHQFNRLIASLAQLCAFFAELLK